MLKQNYRPALVWLTILLSQVFVMSSAHALSALEIFQRSVQAEGAPAWTARSTLTKIKGRRKRVRAGIVFNLKREQRYGYLRKYNFDTPVNVAGTAFLLHENTDGEDDIWLYLPARKITRRILSSAKKDPFMGSDFAYTDMRSERPELLQHRLIGEVDCAGGKCFQVSSSYLDHSLRKASNYSMFVSLINSTNFLLEQVEYYDLKGRLFKRAKIRNYVSSNAEGTRWIALERSMETLKSGSTSVLTLEQLDTDAALERSDFVESHLRH